MKETLWEYLYFTPAEKRGIIVLFSLICLVFALPFLWSSFSSESISYDASAFEAEISEWETNLIQVDSSGRKKYFERNWDYEPSYKKKKTYVKKNKKKKEEIIIKPFSFDPNTATKSELMALGLPQRVVETLINFREKGGQFRKREDLKKVYGLKDEWYGALEQHIRIEKIKNEEQQFSENNYSAGKKDFRKEPGIIENNKKDTSEKPKETFPKKEYDDKPLIIDINNSTADEFQKLRGIGPSYSKRIINYREALGGFYNVSQISEVYGLPDSTFQSIKGYLIQGMDNPKIRQININSVSAEELKKHPYLSWKQANAIVKYRGEHGTFESLDELDKIYALSPELRTKLRPYLRIN